MKEYFEKQLILAQDIFQQDPLNNDEKASNILWVAVMHVAKKSIRDIVLNTPNLHFDSKYSHIIQRDYQILDTAINDYMSFGFVNNGNINPYTYFGLKTIIDSYLLRDPETNIVIENPYQMYMRVAVVANISDGIINIEPFFFSQYIKSPTPIKPNYSDLEKTFMYLLSFTYTHASPTIFNAGLRNGQLASCYLMSLQQDSIEGIYKTAERCAKISKEAGGIGLDMMRFRGSNREIKGTNGRTKGFKPIFSLFDTTSKLIYEGGAKRPGSIAMYIEPWHYDIEEFLELRTTDDTRSLFYGLWVPNLFMRRVQNDERWTLFSPEDTPCLLNKYGEDFDEKYEEYERSVDEKKVRVVQARDLWKKILEKQLITGMPYILYKDHCISRSNQKNFGTIRCSNLCTEIIQISDQNRISVCNLASISLPAFVVDVGVDGTYNGLEFEYASKQFSFKKLKRTVKLIVKNLTNIIYTTHYPVPEAEETNKQTRPIGIGIQGWANVLISFELPWSNPEARRLNRMISECIYYVATKTSVKLAKCKHPGKYPLYDSSLTSSSGGMDCFEFTRYEKATGKKVEHHIDIKEWEKLAEDIKTHGMANSLLIAHMPTASTSQIMGNNECFEPYTRNVYVRDTKSGSFMVINRQMVEYMKRINVWEDWMLEDIARNDGSIQHLKIPDEVKELFKTAFEIPLKTQIDMVIDRAPYVDQSMSFNMFINDTTGDAMTKLSKALLYSWMNGLKTGSYYTHTSSHITSMKMISNISKQGEEMEGEKKEPEPSLSLCNRMGREKEDCLSCSS